MVASSCMLFFIIISIQIDSNTYATILYFIFIFFVYFFFWFGKIPIKAFELPLDDSKSRAKSSVLPSSIIIIIVVHRLIQFITKVFPFDAKVKPKTNY